MGYGFCTHRHMGPVHFGEAHTFLACFARIADFFDFFFFFWGGTVPPATPPPPRLVRLWLQSYVTDLSVGRQTKKVITSSGGGGGRCTTICLKIHNRVKTYLKGGMCPFYPSTPWVRQWINIRQKIILINNVSIQQRHSDCIKWLNFLQNNMGSDISLNLIGWKLPAFIEVCLQNVSEEKP